MNLIKNIFLCLKYNFKGVLIFFFVFFICFSISYSQNKSLKTDNLPAPFATKSKMNFSKVQGWKNNETPKAPERFTVSKYADGFENPRWMYVTPNGDVLVAESNSNHTLLEKIGGRILGASKANNLKHSADKITLLRDTDKDGKPDVRETFLKNLNQPFGMLIIGDWFYVANTNALWRYPYKTGQNKITEKGEKIIDLPAGKHNRHWTRNIIANADNSKIYIAIGSGTNVAEKGIKNELLRADIIEINPDGSGQRVFASGLRNPVGMALNPDNKHLWVAVNERDLLGDDLVPDYLTDVKENGFYGWPYSYYGKHIDPRVKEAKLELVDKSIIPDVNLGAHTASLGLIFYNGKSFPEKYHNGAFVAQHGSWNRSTLSGYKIVFIPFINGKPSGEPEDFLTGFISDLSKEKVRGRPVGEILLSDGSMLITDDKNNIIWKVSYK